MITGKSHGPESIKVGGRFSPASMVAILQPVNARISAFTNDTSQHFQASASAGSATEIPVKVGSPTQSARAATGYDLQIFLDYAHMEFDKTDYIRLREFIELPPKTSHSEVYDIGCACYLHVKRKKRTQEDHSKKFWATWKKMEECAEMLRLKKQPCEILRDLNKISQALGCQRTGSPCQRN